MAKKDKNEESTPIDSMDSLSLTKALIKELNKDSKEKVAWNLATDADNPTDVKDFISTGSTLLDYVICNRRGGGVPVGKLTEFCGEEASGKSLVVTQILANTQKKGGMAILIDTENALNTDFAQRVGLDLNNLVYLQPGTVEEVGENIEKVITMARAKDVKKIITIVWDSVAGTPTQAEIEGSYDPNDRIGVTAKALAKMMRKITQTLGKDRITLVFTNQLKTKFGVMFGDPMATTGGKAIPYHSSVRVRLNRSVELKGTEDEKEVYAVHTRAKVIKNRMGPPMRKCEFDIYFSHGIDDATSIRDYLHAVGEIEKRNGWMYMTPDGVETKFRAGEFGERFKDTKFKEYVMGLLDKHLIVKYDKNIADQELDPESLMDAEAVADIAING